MNKQIFENKIDFYSNKQIFLQLCVIVGEEKYLSRFGNNYYVFYSFKEKNLSITVKFFNKIVGTLTIPADFLKGNLYFSDKLVWAEPDISPEYIKKVRCLYICLRKTKIPNCVIKNLIISRLDFRIFPPLFSPATKKTYRFSFFFFFFFFFFREAEKEEWKKRSGKKNGLQSRRWIF